MSRDPRVWQAGVVAVGLGLSALAGLLAAPKIGGTDGTIWALWLAYVFALAYGANRLQLWLVRPPIVRWKAAMVGSVVFIPMFLGFFPVANWTMEVGRRTDYRYAPSMLWVLLLMGIGIVAPGGVLVDGWRRVRCALGKTSTP